jgi:hypothetical protein
LPSLARKQQRCPKLRLEAPIDFIKLLATCRFP